MRNATVFGVLVVAVSSPPASAQDDPSGAPESADVAGGGMGLALGLRAQIGFSQVFSDLGVAPAGEIEIGYRIPFLERRLGVFVAAGYQYTYGDGSGADPRLASTDGTPYPHGYSWDLDEHAVIVTLGFLGRIFPESEALSPYLWVGPRVYLLMSAIDGEAGGQAFGENTETSTEVGVAGGVGVEYFLGLGPIFGEIEFAWSPLAHDITGDASTGQLGLTVGYRFLL